MKNLLLLALLALTLPAEAQQSCFGSSCPSAGGGSSTVTSGEATSGFTANSLIWNGASVLGSGPKFLSGNLSLEVGTNYCPDAGANDTYVCTLAGGSLSAYSTGTKITLKANTANTGTATVAVDGLAAITITRRDDSALQTGDISAGDYVPLVYDGNTFRLQRGFQSGVTYDGTTFAVTGAATISGNALVGSSLSFTPSGTSVIVGNTGANSGFAAGQSSTANASFGWLYHATPGLASAYYATFGYSNPIKIDGSAVNIQSLSGGATTINGATTIGGSGITGTTVPFAVSRGSSSGNIANFQTTAGTTVSYFGNDGSLTLAGTGARKINGSNQYIDMDTANKVNIGAPAGVPYLTVDGGTGYVITSAYGLAISSTNTSAGSPDLLLTRGGAAATLQLGATITSGSAINQTFRSHNATTGTDISGGNLTLAAPGGTGSSTGGTIAFQTAPVLASGTTAQTPVDRLTIAKDGQIGLGSATVTSAGTINVPTDQAYNYNGVAALRGQTALNNWFGGNAGNLTATGSKNTAFGDMAGSSLTSGTENTAVGFEALKSVTTHLYNTAVGSGALRSLTTSHNNTAIGQGAGYYTSTGIGQNAYIGAGTGFYQTTQTKNTFVGYSAGATNVVGGNANTIIGANAPLTTGLSNNIILTDGDGVIRYQVDANGATTIGNASITGTTKALTATSVSGPDLHAGIPSKTVADNTITTFATMALGNDTGGCTTLWYTVYAADATTAGSEGGQFTVCGTDVTSGAGGESCTASAVFGNVQDLQGSTLGVTFAVSTGTDLCNIRVTADTNIAVPVSLYIKWGALAGGRTLTPQ